MAHSEKRVRGGRVSYRAPDGTERNRTFRRKADAEKFLATVESAKLGGLDGPGGRPDDLRGVAGGVVGERGRAIGARLCRRPRSSRPTSSSAAP
jgi:hypothetical protein